MTMKNGGVNTAGSPQPGTLRVVLYSHDSQGLGHTRRNLALAHALTGSFRRAGRTVSGVLVTGVAAATRFEAPEGWDWVVVPGIVKGMSGYEPRHLTIRQQDVITLRSSLIAAVLNDFHPHLVVVDRHPFGVEHELADGLEQLRRKRPSCRIVLGLREVLDQPSAARREWDALDLDQVERTFDEFWVYGDPAVHDPVHSGEIPGSLAHLVRHTGYLSLGRPVRRRTGTTGVPFVVTMAGGGSDGLGVTLTAARAELPPGVEHLIVTGPQMPKSDRAQVEAAAGAGTSVVGSVRDALAEIQSAAAVVAMGGYNTVCEIMSTTTPALIVPRVHPRREQLIRARGLARHQLLDFCHPDEFTPDTLSTWWQHVAGQEVPRDGVNLDGLATTFEYASELLAQPAGIPPQRADWTRHAAV
ncbi:glycosyltransferase family protein [Arthrobacter tumbae]|uniref:glycosyltransferase family protein n=1 Tax=Arthrobacter tumbae TaxID=163874 RepID=UPI00195AE6CE|nr:glycosyl transferase family 28 [Arthrobacter tumbae]MBM7779886.1 putative glycosyltransferase [Arthrobacter tumbae]